MAESVPEVETELEGQREYWDKLVDGLSGEKGATEVERLKLQG
jgi:hypothetical protein